MEDKIVGVRVVLVTQKPNGQMTEKTVVEHEGGSAYQVTVEKEFYMEPDEATGIRRGPTGDQTVTIQIKGKRG